MSEKLLISLEEKAYESLKDWNLDILFSKTIDYLDECIKNHWQDEEDDYNLFVEEISPGYTGVYQGKEIIDTFNLWDWLDDDEKDDLEAQWWLIEDFASSLAEAITQAMQNKYDLRGNYYFGHTEGGGDYGLFYTVEVS